ncbi:hypothetical protein CC2G_010036 [Coprinopsis cinerea AmutBmut pab1-1]|nr:hypothetical protein CC2G_010036 [Coprinopsis cinerea AmutBmut pab1-1]
MFVLILLSYVLFPTSATPVPTPQADNAGGSSRPSDSSNTTPPSAPYPNLDLFLSRTFFSCLATVLACLWISVHPNAPSPQDSSWRRLRRRVEVVLWALIVPELVVCWSVRQWVGARNLKERYRVYGWSMTHAHFLQMGGWVVVRPWPSPFPSPLLLESPANSGRLDDPLSSSFRARQVLSPPLLDKLLTLDSKPLSVRSITPPLQVIRNHSSADAIVTAFALLQTLWFICQGIAKAVVSGTKGNVHIRFLRIELVTASYIVMCLIMYVLWWDKPMDVRVLREVVLDLDRDAQLEREWRILDAMRRLPPDDEKEEEEAEREGEGGEDEKNERSDEASMIRSESSYGEELPLAPNPGEDGAPTPENPIVDEKLPLFPDAAQKSQKSEGSSDTTAREEGSVTEGPNDLKSSSTDVANPDTDVHEPSLKSSASHQEHADTNSVNKLPQSSSISSRRSSRSSSASSFRTANRSEQQEIVEVPRSRRPSIRTTRSTGFSVLSRGHADTLDEPWFPRPAQANRPPEPQYDTCHPSAADRLVGTRSQWRQDAAGQRSASRTSVNSIASYSAESTIFESMWDSTRTSYFAEKTGLDWFLNRCGVILVGKWGRKGHRNAVEQEGKHLGKLWMPPSYAGELVDQPQDQLAPKWTKEKLDKFHAKVARLRVRVPTFYASTSASVHDDRLFKLMAGGLGMLFGAIHLIGWDASWNLPLHSSLNLDSSTERTFTILWRVSAMIATVTPLFTILALFRLSEEETETSESSIQYMLMEIMVFPLTLLYIPARLLLMVLTIAEIVRIGEEWDTVIQAAGPLVGEWGEGGVLRWTRFIPHFQ